MQRNSGNSGNIPLNIPIKVSNKYKHHNIFCRILEKDEVDETDQPEDEDKDEEKHWIDHPHEGLAEINLPVSLILADWSLSESVYEVLHQGVHEGFEDTEDQPAVDHFDVGGVGQIGAHTNNKYLSEPKTNIQKILELIPLHHLFFLLPLYIQHIHYFHIQ